MTNAIRLARFERLVGLARGLEMRAPRYGFRNKHKLLTLALIYNEMAIAASSKVLDRSARAQAIQERDELWEKLRTMAAERPTRPVEADKLAPNVVAVEVKRSTNVRRAPTRLRKAKTY